MMMIRVLLPFIFAATTACAGGLAPGERTGLVELSAQGCYASRAGWLSFGDPERADTVVRSWLILDWRMTRNADESAVARLLGWQVGGEHARRQEARLGFWREENDSIRVWWHDGFHGADMYVLPEGDSLIGSARNTTDQLVRDSTGTLVGATYTRQVRAERVPCGQVPARLERRTRIQEPFFGMPVIESR